MSPDDTAPPSAVRRARRFALPLLGGAHPRRHWRPSSSRRTGSAPGCTSGAITFRGLSGVEVFAFSTKPLACLTSGIDHELHDTIEPDNDYAPDWVRQTGC
jgi:hypothetical protein